MANVNGTHRINNEFIRVPVERDLATKDGLKGLRHIKPSQVGAGKPISEAALHEAVATKNGFKNLNWGIEADVYVAKINKKPVLVTTAEDEYAGVQRFVMQSPKSGSVIGRGNISHATGKVEWTRSHNGATASQKAETNDA
ncbi:MAG: hypothetical protein U1E65_07910 [Myxococcota bacterium]